jgi:hypothetical protein
MGPVKWEAPESLQHKEYSEKTDAFSYAVCLYEMVSQKDPWEEETHAQVGSSCLWRCVGELFSLTLPFLVSQFPSTHIHKHTQVAYQVICGQRLPVALNCDPVLAEVMHLCWQQDPRRRPNFEYIYRRLKERHTQVCHFPPDTRSL